MTPSVGGAEPSIGWEASADLVVVGGGVAGLSAAISATRRGLRVVTLAKGDASGTSTQYAQGGIAVPGTAAEGDSVDSHVHDTCEAGVGLCDEDAVRSIVEAGPAALSMLESLGAVFDRGVDGARARTREGGHRVRRIVHAGGDATGAEVQRALSDSMPSVLHGTSVIRVLVDRGDVVGVLAHSAAGYGVVHAPAVLLATGGLGQLFSCSTNPPEATADGIALALDAGAEIMDLEFVQFHPTVLFAPGSTGRRPLVSEAVRGEGAHLVDLTGIRFVADSHPLGDLAPRDVVSRAIAERMRLTGSDHVMLDARAIRHFHTRFPTVTASCLAAGIDPLDDLIPIAPAAHYSCGGVATDVWGRTSVPGLFAAGEVARTGLHGANRLASNSLLEGLVVGERAGIAAAERRGRRAEIGDVSLPSTASMPRATLQALMTENAGVVRDAEGLETVVRALDGARAAEMHEKVWEDAALTTAASVLALAASAREESRGCHTRRDCPDMSSARSSRVRRDEAGDIEIRGVEELTGVGRQ
ncbi:MULTISPECIES: L-aspartate oxidase [unclassified Rhodococcus (in: high G+C Gram-positive bacteria)]|uniref:L-aspartate oxidase n=1 Tax=unclassified Rhodococcus (in: high G+C Gram-positive bacteria) TaxID=192944 RepID=UPI0027E1A7CA|nr:MULTISPECIES: L-aspartate oxidase [unclassified Rhodococcus (in: high G+C Gram-positive bacteria)]